MQDGAGDQSEQRGRKRPLLSCLRVLPLVLCALAFVTGPATRAGPAPARCLAGPSPHGGGLNGCGCHFNRKTGACHCHRPRACGCECQPSTC